MITLSGKTRNGFTYEGEYETASGGRILWSATFRLDGDYAGVRHGRLLDVQDVSAAAATELVQANIEATWINAT